MTGPLQLQTLHQTRIESKRCVAALHVFEKRMVLASRVIYIVERPWLLDAKDFDQSVRRQKFLSQFARSLFLHIWNDLLSGFHTRQSLSSDENSWILEENVCMAVTHDNQFTSDIMDDESESASTVRRSRHDVQ